MEDFLKDLLMKFYDFIIAALPRSPFSAFINSIGSVPYLAQLNWFIPVSEIIAVTEAWLAAIVLYYLYSAILRYIKVIG